MESRNIIPERLYSLDEIAEAFKLSKKMVLGKIRYWEANKEENKEPTFIIYESKINKS
jgi:predicted DNA-binding protein YlxM (UPF0122 family)